GGGWPGGGGPGAGRVGGAAGVTGSTMGEPPVTGLPVVDGPAAGRASDAAGLPAAGPLAGEVPGGEVPVTGPVSYAAAGVDIEAGDRAVELMRSAVDRTRRPEVVGGLGGVAGLFALEPRRDPRPPLASAPHGGGTQLAHAPGPARPRPVGSR